MSSTSLELESVESLTRFGMEKLLLYEKPSIGGKPVLGENLRAVVESSTRFGWRNSCFIRHHPEEETFIG